MLFTDCFHPLDASIVPKTTQIYIIFGYQRPEQLFRAAPGGFGESGFYWHSS
jgi:hypothetical protein